MEIVVEFDSHIGRLNVYINGKEYDGKHSMERPDYLTFINKKDFERVYSDLHGCNWWPSDLRVYSKWKYSIGNLDLFQDERFQIDTNYEYQLNISSVGTGTLELVGFEQDATRYRQTLLENEQCGGGSETAMEQDDSE